MDNRQGAQRSLRAPDAAHVPLRRPAGRARSPRSGGSRARAPARRPGPLPGHGCPGVALAAGLRQLRHGWLGRARGGDSRRQSGPPRAAARIFTGAPIPTGADAVVRQEAARASDDGLTVELFISVPPGNDIRRTGEEVLAGAPLFSAGQCVNASVFGVLASQGETTVQVRPAPRVAVLATGDELVRQGEPALAHQVYESNLVLVAALAREAGAQVLHMARARDDEEALREALTRLAPQVDVLITTGGASVGDKDHVKRVLAAMGARFFVDGVALKPGKPVAVARLGNTTVVV